MRTLHETNHESSLTPRRHAPCLDIPDRPAAGWSVPESDDDDDDREVEATDDEYELIFKSLGFGCSDKL